MKIDHFFIKQLKKNKKILIIFLINIALIIFLITTFINYLNVFNQQQKLLVSEINNLEQKRDLIKSFENAENLDLDNLNKILFLLIPNSEDHFSIINALEKISSKTNFLITNYSLNLVSTSPQKLAVNISGIGNRDDFLNFIRDYKFSGYRLITIDKIVFSETKANLDKKITLNFYIDKKEKREFPAYILKKSDYELINKIQSAIKLNEVIKNTKEPPSEKIQYKTKTNPF